ncbi:uncharacterized protein SPPG_08848 [Spizellomyces punctatus DAOM BR117]|uniref:Uncharacterized protein n=1 Tax=Spizellomyces punctatus (strain DAOM BR117) TaxID=645134 RepID=A0A0L0HUD9_SPIPD|nr:uncharacterized protein SPPG_08848 [Spizellomyces punctatus DAOM BR117]KND04723.1 hypothetical protein SPPG_08848 [Spizellomyces punctatus DAOM BR117]|eukprot:XP_016612762.1 hypothetical protein SPPG_08848 [Spizellomyces punctatus DAOM BR117]
MDSASTYCYTLSRDFLPKGIDILLPRLSCTERCRSSLVLNDSCQVSAGLRSSTVKSICMGLDLEVDLDIPPAPYSELARRTSVRNRGLTTIKKFFKNFARRAACTQRKRETFKKSSRRGSDDTICSPMC